MVLKNIKSALVIVLLFFSCNVVAVAEWISLFESDITINKDSSMRVVESISYHHKKSNAHGILREFPTRYHDRMGTSYHVGFNVGKIERDGRREEYASKHLDNGVRLWIGSKNQLLPPGKYTYTIEYVTNKQLGYFEKYDELYWNVNGSGWRCPIERIRAVVHLPTGTHLDQVGVDAYTGRQGEQGKDFTVKQHDNNTLVFETTRPFAAKEGLTIVATWPKGLVTQPTQWDYFWWFVHDNLYLLLSFLALLLLIVYYIGALVFIRSKRIFGTIIPRFYPPENMCPAAINYLVHKEYRPQALAAEIVQMAVRGMIMIESKPQYISWSRTYRLYRSGNDSIGPENEIQEAVKKLIEKNQGGVTLGSSSSGGFTKTVLRAQSYLRTSCDKYIDSNVKLSMIGLLLSLLFLLPLWTLMFQDGRYEPWLFVIPVAALCLLFLFGKFCRVYTHEGQKLYEEIQGFKMFLQATESERFAVIGTPPTRTPELYETYLPYAIALGVEDQWSRQFAPLFAQLEKQGVGYHPLWYVGPGPFRSQDMRAFSSQLSSSLSTVVSSSSTPPGRSSGSGGSGRSGGGGGGGGGGGW